MSTVTCPACTSVGLAVGLTLVITLLVVGVVLLLLWCCCFNAWLTRRARRLQETNSAAHPRLEIKDAEEAQNRREATRETAISPWGLPIGFKDYLRENQIPVEKLQTVGIQKLSPDLHFSVLNEGGAIFVSHMEDSARERHLKKLSLGQHLIGMTVLFNKLDHQTVARLIVDAADSGYCDLYVRNDQCYDLEGGPGASCKAAVDGVDLEVPVESVINVQKSSPSFAAGPRIEIVHEKASPQLHNLSTIRQEGFENDYLTAPDTISINISDDEEGLVIPLPEIRTLPDKLPDVEAMSRTSSVPSPKPQLTRGSTFDDIDDVLIASNLSQRPHDVGEDIDEPMMKGRLPVDTDVLSPPRMLTVTATPASCSPDFLEAEANTLTAGHSEASPPASSTPTPSRPISPVSQPSPESPPTNVSVLELLDHAAPNLPPRDAVDSYITSHRLPDSLTSSSHDGLSRQTSSGVFSLASPPDAHSVDGSAESEKEEEEIVAPPTVHQLFAAPTVRYDTSHLPQANVGFLNEGVTSFSDGGAGTTIQEEEEDDIEPEELEYCGDDNWIADDDDNLMASTSFSEQEIANFPVNLDDFEEEKPSYLEEVPEEDEEAITEDPDHFQYQLDDGEFVEQTSQDGVYIDRRSQNGEYMKQTSQDGDYIDSKYQDGEYVSERSQDGEYIEQTSQDGVYIEQTSQDGEYIDSKYQDGEYVSERSQDGEYIEQTSHDGVYIEEVSQDGEYIDERSQDGEYIEQTSQDGEYIDGKYQDGEYIEQTSQDGEYIEQTSQDEEYIEQTSQDEEYIDGRSQNGEYVEETSQNGDYVDESSQDGEYVEETSQNGDYVDESSQDGEYVEEGGIQDGEFAEELSEDGEYSYDEDYDGYEDPPYLERVTEEEEEEEESDASTSQPTAQEVVSFSVRGYYPDERSDTPTVNECVLVELENGDHEERLGDPFSTEELSLSSRGKMADASHRLCNGEDKTQLIRFDEQTSADECEA